MGCARVTFVEQIDGLTGPHAHYSPPLRIALTAIALALAGRPGARLAAALGIAVGRDPAGAAAPGELPPFSRRHSTKAGVAHKSHNSTRTLLLDPVTLNILTEGQTHVTVPTRSPYMFTGRTGQPLRPDNLTSRFNQLATAAGVCPIGPHQILSQGT